MGTRILAAMMCVAVAGVAPAGEGAPGVAGAYLKARQAAGAHDDAAAHREAPSHGGARRDVAERAILSRVNAGDLPGGAALARAARAAGAGGQVGALAILAETARAGDWDGARALLDGGLGVGPLVDGLARGWAAAGTGDRAAATAAFDAVIAARGLRTYGLVHKAYALGALGDDAGAEAIWSGAAPEAGGQPPPLSRRAAGARIAGLARLGRAEAAVHVLDRLFGPAPGPALAAMRAAILAGEAPPPPVADARAGLAEGFFAVASAVRGEAVDDYTLLYLRAAQALDPGHEGAASMAAALLRGPGRPGSAVTAYGPAPEGAARPGTASAPRGAVREADATALLAVGRSGGVAAAHDPSLAVGSGARAASRRVLFGRAPGEGRAGRIVRALRHGPGAGADGPPRRAARAAEG